MEIDNITGAQRHIMTKAQLTDLYKKLENFVSDCTWEEYCGNADAIKIVQTMIHQRMQKAK